MIAQKNIFQYYVSCITTDVVRVSGRARRKEYWSFSLVSVLVSIALTGVDYLVFGYLPEGDSLLSFSTTYAVISLVPSIAVAIRRIHDLDKENWLIGVYLMFCFPTVSPLFGIDAYEMLGQTLDVFFIIPLVAVALVVWLIVALFTSGTLGPNDFGPDPKNPILGSEIDQIGVE